MGLKNPKILERLFIAALFCDIGELIPNPENKTHQQLSIDFMEAFGHISDDIKQAMLHHHENNDGTGPFKIFKHKIHPYARIIRVVDELLHLITIKDKDFLIELKKQSVQKLDSTIVSILLKLLKPNEKK